MNELIVSWGLAALSYNEDHIIDYVRELFGLKVYCKHDKNGSLFYGCAVDETTGRLNIFNRGTDGFNAIGNAKSWVRNARLITGRDGIHNGFFDASAKVFESFLHQICDAETVIISGQSQGAALTTVESYIIASEVKSVKAIRGHAFACPPAFNKHGAERFKPYLDSNRVTLTRYNTTGDPVDSDALRDDDSLLRDGVDVGDEIELFPIIKFKCPISMRLIRHSNAITNAALMQMEAMKDNPSIEDIRLLGEIGKRIIN